MNAVVIYESLTGNTRRAGELIAAQLRAAGWSAVACPVTAVDYQAVSAAELVVIGTWTDGLIIAGQRPGRAGRIRRLPVLTGKRAAVYCTYAIDAGRTLEKLAAIVEGLGAEMVGGMSIRRDKIDGGVADFVGRLLAVVAA